MSIYLYWAILLITSNPCIVFGDILSSIPKTTFTDDDIQSVLEAARDQDPNAKPRQTKPSPARTSDEKPMVTTWLHDRTRVTGPVDNSDFDFAAHDNVINKPFNLRKQLLANPDPRYDHLRDFQTCLPKDNTLVCPTPGRTICISAAQLCDGNADCPGASDELPTQCMFAKLVEGYDRLLDNKLAAIEANLDNIRSQGRERKNRIRSQRNKEKQTVKRQVTVHSHHVKEN